METLDNSEWDVVIVGTGLQQSLLALALSRSGKKILHVDDNDYYGGAHAAFSLQEAEEWAERVNEEPFAAAFSNVSIFKPQPEPTEAEAGPSLSFSRAYSLELSPQLVYARSSLLQYLVSSRVYRQLEFLAVGSFWVYAPGDGGAATASEGSIEHGKLLKVPSGREDIFQDQVLDFKAKRALMKFLRFIADYEDQPEVWEEHCEKPFPAFLSEQFKLPVALQDPLLALTLSPVGSEFTTTGYALPRIARHLRSIGVFGPGFGAVLPKWGGMSEIVQVSCRACAVGGGVYVLGKGLSDVAPAANSDTSDRVTLRLKDGETVTSRWVVQEEGRKSTSSPMCCKSVTIVSSPLTPLFPPIAEEAPSPASAVVVFPPGSLSLAPGSETGEQLPPVHIFVHSSETGECPAGQTILYASTSSTGESGFQLLEKAIEALLSTQVLAPRAVVLWTLQLEQETSAASTPGAAISNECMLGFPSSSLDIAFDDSMLDRVKEAWQKIMGEETNPQDFLMFPDREGIADDDE